MCDDNGQSTQHIGDEWMRRKIRYICNFDVSDRWIKMFRRKHGIRYFSGRRHADKANQLIPLAALDNTKAKTSNYLKARRTLRTTRKEYEEVDKLVKEEIDRRQKHGERLTNPWIREYAQIVASEMYPEVSEIEKFFDANWLYRFKRRNSVELKPRSPDEKSEQLPKTILMKEEGGANSKKEALVEESSTLNFKTDDVQTNLFQLIQFQHYWSLMNGGSLVMKDPPMHN